MSVMEEARLLEFFQQLYQYDEGYVCIATTRPPAKRDTFTEQFFKWPSEREGMVEYIDRVRPSHNVYFCVNVLSVPRRKKNNAIPQNLVWADLDTCHPNKVEIPPQVVIESSPNRWQAIWKIDQKVDPFEAESFSKRIAYMYADQGADKSGHDLTQLLRVPGTYNFKYQMDDTPVVQLVADIDDVIAKSVFDALPHPEGVDKELPILPVPKLESLPSYDMIVYRYTDTLVQNGMMNAFARYVGEEPREDWSGQLWNLILLSFEAGMTADEVFVVAKSAKCNKYERDGRPDSHLWREVLKAELERKTVEVLLREHKYLRMPSLLDQAEAESVQPTLIDDYLGWATEVTDAVEEYHELTCAVLMSCLMSTTLRLRTSRAQTIVPNLWALIFGESTLTRKTTAMSMGMDFIMDIDPDLVVASDASMEGLITNLSLRPKMVSIFYRDEITGFFQSVQQKEYLAGMQEMLTQMYDVPQFLKRTLKKDTYVVTEPIFIMFGGGIASRAYSLIDDFSYISGFMPRFLVMNGKAEISKIRPLGPPVAEHMDRRNDIAATFQSFYSMYTNTQVPVTLGDGQTMLMSPEYDVQFTPEMWQKAAEMERTLIIAADESPEKEKALPTFNRMYISLLKLTMLFAGARQEPQDNKVYAEMGDMLAAAKYIERWGRHAVDLIRNSGHNADEAKLQACYRSVQQQPGILRSEIMQRHRLNAREMESVEQTLIQRQLIEVIKKGNKFRTYWPIGR